ncbi:hepatocyte growth factor receptor-like isoform X4 [Halichondria panicea]|uniref:hepatocyte growth factor receptor-like isoform X4 n=1 Tax=Halichondria panicea TaxID=6063 RepID=UPI00312B548E
MKLKTSSVSTLLFLIFVRKSLAQVITTGQSRQGNEITFTCESFDQEAIKIRVVSVIADGSNGTAPFVNVSRTSTTAMARFTVTPSDEKAAYCGAGNVSTNLVYFGASPVLKTTLTRLLAIVGSVHTLECSYELGTASDDIDPYHHIWFKDQSNDIITEELSRTLNISITRQSPDIANYTCALRMRECSACGRLVDYPSLNTPQFQLTKVVPLSIDVAPVSQNVSAGTPVTFVCAAEGTSIDIIWLYDGNTYTANNENVNISSVDSAYVRSELELSSPSSSGSVICIVRQLFDGTNSLDNNNFNNNLPGQNRRSTAELIIIPETTSPTTTMLTISTTTAATGTVTVTAIIILSLAAVGTSFFIVSVTCFIVCFGLHKRRQLLKANQIIATTGLSDIQETTLSTNEMQSTELPPETAPSPRFPTSFNTARVPTTDRHYSSTTKQSTGSLILGNAVKLPDLPESLKIPGSWLKLSSDPIGQGETGVVYKGILMNWKDEPLQAVAVKTLKGLFSSSDIQFLMSEIIKMKDFNHPHVMPLIGVCLDAGPGVSMVMPHMTNGSVLDYLKQERNSLKLTDNCSKEKAQSVRKLLLRMCHQIALGMEYLSQQRFIHRDLAARNCMLDSSGDVRVGDFGLAEDVHRTGYFRQNERADIKLPYKWMALESLNNAIFTEKTDVWSYGVTMWEVFSGGQIPYPGVDVRTLVNFLQRGNRLDAPVNTACTAEISAVMQRCWLEDSEERPSFTDLSSKMDAMLSSVSDTTELNMELRHNSQDPIDMSGYDDLNESLRNRATRTNPYKLSTIV